jgi:hypothetical protein
MPRELARQHVGLVGELEFLEQRLAALGRTLDVEEPGGQRKVLAHGQVLEQVRLVGEPGEDALGLDGVGAQVVAVDHDRPGGRREDTDDAAQRGGLAGAVRADQAENLAGRDREVEVLHGNEVSVVLGEALDLDQRDVLSSACVPAKSTLPIGRGQDLRESRGIRECGPCGRRAAGRARA